MLKNGAFALYSFSPVREIRRQQAATDLRAGKTMKLLFLTALVALLYAAGAQDVSNPAAILNQLQNELPECAVGMHRDATTHSGTNMISSIACSRRFLDPR